jgi:ribosomal protein S7
MIMIIPATIRKRTDTNTECRIENNLILAGESAEDAEVLKKNRTGRMAEVADYRNDC